VPTYGRAGPLTLGPRARADHSEQLTLHNRGRGDWNERRGTERAAAAEHPAGDEDGFEEVGRMIIGVDPGASGGLAMLSGSGEFMGGLRMPIVKVTPKRKVVDLSAISTWVFDTRSVGMDGVLRRIVRQEQTGQPRQGPAQLRRQRPVERQGERRDRRGCADRPLLAPASTLGSA